MICTMALKHVETVIYLRAEEKCMATVRQIAKMADVSPATVSRVFNRYEHVRHEVRERVIRTMRELGTNLRTRNVAVLISEDSAFQGYSGLMLAALLRELRKQGYREVIVTENSASLLREQPLDGAVSMLVREGMEQLWKAEHCLPLVCINASPRRLGGVASVISNDRQGVERALKHLESFGHSRIGYLSCDAVEDRQNSSGLRRYKAYQEWMALRGLAPVIIRSIGEVEGAVRKEGLTALLVIGEMHGLPLCLQLRAAGWKIPEELSVVGFRNSSFSLPGILEVTALEQNFTEIAAQAIALLQALTDHRPVNNLEINYRFVPGETVAPPMKQP